MLNWLKYVFLSFFSDRHAAEARERSGFNIALFVLLSLAFMLLGPSIGYLASFDKHYDDATEFRRLLYSIVDENELSVENGKLTSSNDFVINTREDGQPHKYEVIIDTKNASQTFDALEVICTDDNGAAIDYDKYFRLDVVEKRKYTLTVRRTGRAVEFTQQNLDKFVSVLQSSEVYAEDYDALYAKKDSMTEAEYNNALYVLFVKEYYPGWVYSTDQYGEAPTLKSYYLATVNELADSEKNFFFAIDNVAAMRFTTDSGVSIVFSGEYNDFSGRIDSHKRADEFVKALFDSYSVADGFYNTFSNLKFLLIFVVAWALLAVLMNTIDKLIKGNENYDRYGFYGFFKIISGYFIVSAFFAFVASLTAAFFAGYNATIIWLYVVFVCSVLIRSAVFLIREELVYKKTAHNDIADDWAGIPEPDDQPEQSDEPTEPERKLYV